MGMKRAHHVLGRQDHVHGPGLEGAARHVVMGRLIEVLREDEPAVLLDRLRATAAIAALARQDDPHGLLARGFRQ